MYAKGLWSTKVLIIFWVLHISIQLTTIAPLTLLLLDEQGTFERVPASDITFMMCLAVTLVLGAVEMQLLSLRRLEPLLYVFFQIFKALFAAAFGSNELYRFLATTDRRLLPIDETAAFAWALLINAGLAFLMMLIFCLSLMHGLIIYRRHRKSRTHDITRDRTSHGRDASLDRWSSRISDRSRRQ